MYCSGIAFKEGSGATVITAEDIRQNARGRQLAYWVTNDSCPPSPGCELRSKSPNPAASGVSFADVWQFAQSPRSSQAAAPRTTATMETVTLLVAKLSDCARPLARLRQLLQNRDFSAPG